MYSPTLVRKVLFDIFQQLSTNDVEAANFFIRSETSHKCTGIFDLMEVLEKLAYFYVSKNKVKLQRLIELFENINRVDLQKRLQTYADELPPCCNNFNDSIASVSSNGDEERSNSSKHYDSSEEKTDLKGNNINDSIASVSSNGDEERSNSSKHYDSSEEETDLKGFNINDSIASASSNGDEEKSNSVKHSDPSKEEIGLKESVWNPDKKNLNLPAIWKNRRILAEFDKPLLNPKEIFVKTQEIENPSVSAALNSAEDTSRSSKPQLKANEIDELEVDFLQMSLDPDVIAENNINNPLDSSMDEESSSDETSSNSEASSSDIKLYNYQRELGEKGKTGANSIICSPTGSGKTITAASIIKHNLENAKERDQFYRVLYLVHIRYLVKHLAIDLKKILGDEVYSLEDDDLLTSEVVQSKAVVILTAQILDNALNKDISSESVRLSDYDLLVFDECHNTVRKHPYNEIMKKYHALKRHKKRVPQILGLSATLAGGHDPFRAIVKLCANMHSLSVSCVRNPKNVKELLEKNKAPIIDQIIPCQSRPKGDTFFYEISKNMRKYILDLETEHKIEFSKSTQVGSEEMESFLTQQKKKCEREKLRVPVKIFEFLIIMNKALMYYNELRASDALDYLEENRFEPGNFDMDIEREIASVYKMLIKNIKHCALDDKIENNDKLKRLTQLLFEILKPNPSKKVILLCRTRFNTIHLKELLMEDQELNKFVKADFLIGRNDNGMTQKQQAEKLKSFEKGELNVLIATSIAEQGLNVPDCQIVIRYLYVTSDISRKQAHGRARKENSKCYLIAEEDNDLITRDYRNKLREKEMDAALKRVAEMGPKTFKEEVLKRIKFLYDEADSTSELGNSKYTFQARDVNILCKECHTLLCCGSDILKKGTDYICTNPDFVSKVTVIPGFERHFRLDSNIGIFKCKDMTCKNRFGALKKYNFGERRTGYVLNSKSILFQLKGADDKFELQKWSKHPFPIETEPLS